MNASVLRTEPASIRAGDSADWRLALPDYPAGAGWVVTYTLVRDGAKISIVGTAEGDEHRFHPLPAETAAWTPGGYHWQARVSNGTDAYTVRTGTIDILPDFSALTAGGMDARTHAQRTLAAIEAWIESHDLAVAELEIAGRRMKSIPMSDLLLLRDRYRREVRAASGQSGRVYVRF